MEEALQDIPPLIHDIQERLKGISESVAVDGKPRSKLPNRRLLWDRLKPQASAVSFRAANVSDVWKNVLEDHRKKAKPIAVLMTS